MFDIPAANLGFPYMRRKRKVTRGRKRPKNKKLRLGFEPQPYET